MIHYANPWGPGFSGTFRGLVGTRSNDAAVGKSGNPRAGYQVFDTVPTMGWVKIGRGFHTQCQCYIQVLGMFTYVYY